MQQAEAMRRLGLTIAAALAIVGALASRAVAAPDLAAYVNPFNGTRAGAPNFGTGGGAGNTFPGPGVPFGMIQWGPDTSPSSDNAGGGYAYHHPPIPGDSGGSVHIDRAGREVTGSASSGGFCFEPNKYKVYFAARFNRPFTAYGTWTRQLLLPGSTSAQDSASTNPSAMSGHGPTAQTGAYVTFDTTKHRLLEARIGISFVSVASARRNLEAEAGGRALPAGWGGRGAGGGRAPRQE